MVTSKEIKKLTDFLLVRGIKFVITGTTALRIHGLLPQDTEPHDLDIIVITDNNKPKERAAIMDMLKELEVLSGCEYCDEHYSDRVYIFKIGENNIKVNAFEGNIQDVHYITALCPDDTNPGKQFPVNIHGVDEILQAKFSIGRKKDYTYFMQILTQLISYFRPCLKK